MPSGPGNPPIHVIFRGFELKFRFCNGPYMIACFHEHLTWELWTLVHWVKKWCWFQIWQSNCCQSNSSLWTFKRRTSKHHYKSGYSFQQIAYTFFHSASIQDTFCRVRLVRSAAIVLTMCIMLVVQAQKSNRAHFCSHKRNSEALN